MEGWCVHFSRLIAPVMGMEVNALVERLKVDGYILESPEMFIEQLAEKHEADTEVILLLMFR